MAERDRPPSRGTALLSGEHYECPHCDRGFEAWPGPCPHCGLAVVRVVDPEPVPDI